MSDHYVDREFMIFNVSELNKINFNEVLETSEDTVRISVDLTKTFVKWNGTTPPCVQSLTTSEGPYTCLLYTSPSPRDRQKSRMPSSA